MLLREITIIFKFLLALKHDKQLQVKLKMENIFHNHAISRVNLSESKLPISTLSNLKDIQRVWKGFFHLFTRLSVRLA